MRELKFRVWNKAHRKYLPPCQTLIDGKSGLFRLTANDNCIFGTVFRTSYLRRNRESEFVIEQFTGLKDKNGTEIYEGDVVKVEGDGEIYQVEWINSGFGLEPRYNSPRYPILGNVKLRKKIKVIGNIHEEPELEEEK